MRRFFFFLIFVFSLSACSPKSLVEVDRQPFTVYASPPAETWLPFLYNCAERSPELLVTRTPEIDSANLSLHLGEAALPFTGESYQIAATELLLVANPENVIPALKIGQVRDIFTGKIRNWAELGGDDAKIQIWGYAAEDELQVAFNEMLLEGYPLSSLARQAQTPEMMREAIIADKYALGFLPENWGGDELEIIPTENQMLLPVLVTLNGEAHEAVKTLLFCLQ